MTHNDIIVDVRKQPVMTPGHDVRDGVGDHLEGRAPVDPAERDPYIKEVLILPFYAKFQGVSWVHPQIPKYCRESKFEVTVVKVLPIN